MPDEPLFVEERRRVILEQLKQFGRVSVRALSETLNVSAVTIRQDLRALEETGLLERTYGGAVRKIQDSSALPELSFEIRKNREQQAKQVIGAMAATLIRDGYSIALDASTTASAIVPHLKNLGKMTIVTNSLIIAQNFLDTPQVQVLLPGGRLRRDSVSLVGRSEALPDINLNIGFFGARGISTIGGVSETDVDEVAMKQAMMARCITKVIVADGSKWGQVATYTFATPQQIQRIITTDDAPIELVEEFRGLGVLVDILPTEP
jgi:DeoR/GlpR family transcriptional regulator of sugar metabolism